MASDLSLNVCSNTAYLNAVDQRTRFKLFNIPPTRYNNLVNNPYNKQNPSTGQTYTTYDLNMRRKAEILKYSSNRMSTQTNNLTKSQIYAQSAKNSKKSYSLEFIQANTVNGVITICPPEGIIKTPSTASDVPGPPILLYEDPAVTLYHYTKDVNAYGIINQDADPYTIPYRDVSYNNVLQTDASFYTLFSVYMFNVDTPRYMFSLESPILLTVSGSSIVDFYSPNSGTNKSNTFQIQLESVFLNVLYSSSSMTIPTPTYSFNTTSPITSYLPIVDISAQDISNTTTQNYSAQIYLGTIKVSNIILPVSLGYIYDFQLSLSFLPYYPTNSNYLTNYSTPTITTKLNTTTSTVIPPTHCKITQSYISPGTYRPPYIQGTPTM